MQSALCSTVQSLYIVLIQRILYSKFQCIHFFVVNLVSIFKIRSAQILVLPESPRIRSMITLKCIEFNS